MPTRENLLHLESLIDATTLLLETKKNVERVEHDIKVMKAKVLRKDGQFGGGDGEDVAMDVDQEVVADEDDAGTQSRSARKKNVRFSTHKDSKVWALANLSALQARRSMSISSVDTTAQPGRSNKRQKQG